MSFLFGWYGFKLKSYSVEELDLKKEIWKDSVFEVRQQVFHLFWIPFFSIGKKYAVRKQGELYDIPENIIYKIKLKGKVKTPWYSFLLIILAVFIPMIVGIYIFIGEAIMKHNYYKQDKELYEVAIADVEKKLKTLQQNAYLRIIRPDVQRRDDIEYLKLVEISGENYSFLRTRVNFPEREENKYYFKTISNDTIVLSNQQLEQAVCKDYDILIDHKPLGVPFFGNQKYIITNVEYFEEPVIYGEIDWDFWNANRYNTFSYQNNFRNGGIEIDLNFQNFGASADLIAIKNIENNIKWTDSLPVHFAKYQYLQDTSIKGITKEHNKDFKFKSLFIFQDSLKRKSEFLVQGNDYRFSIKREK